MLPVVVKPPFANSQPIKADDVSTLRDIVSYPVVKVQGLLKEQSTEVGLILQN